MSLTENGDQVFLPGGGGVQQNSKFEIWPLHYKAKHILNRLLSCFCNDTIYSKSITKNLKNPFF